MKAKSLSFILPFLILALAAPASRAEYVIGKGFVVKSPDDEFTLSIGGRTQGRFDFIDWDSDRDIDNEATFSVRRARLVFKGQVFGDKNRFSIHIGADALRAYWEEGTTYGDLKIFDAFVQHVFSERAALKFGQFKTPFSRQHSTPGSKLQFPDRSHATEILEYDFRDTGMELAGAFKDGMVQYTAQIVNGDGRNTLNADDSLAFYGRLTMNPTGDYGYAEGDTGRKNPEELATTFGVGVHVTTDETQTVDSDVLRLNVNGGLKLNGFSVQGEYYRAETDPDNAAKSTDESFYVQSGYYVVPDKFEIAARGSWLMPEEDDSDEMELSLGVNYLIKGHRLKWQAAYSYFSNEVPASSDLDDHRLVFQVQLMF